jgi:UTP--glucose-1-phosphate uridylyltransferase
METEKTPAWFKDWFKQTYQQFISQPITPLHTNDINDISKSFTTYQSIKTTAPNPANIAIVKLNGGLGTSMGCTSPKSLIPCQPNGNTFLDTIIKQTQHMPWIKKTILLNSFNTHTQTRAHLKKQHPNTIVEHVIQHAFPKIDKNTNKPLPTTSPNNLNPPGHGSVYFDLYHSGILHQCEKENIHTLFISNADNLAATCDPHIATHMQKNNIPFLIELTPKTKNDTKGGTIINYKNQLTLWEIAQVTPEQQTQFTQQPVFNTNNIWVHIPTLIKTIESNKLTLDLIQNQKTQDNKPVIQLEYAMGSAIQSFPNAQALMVPRSRFFPIKKMNDLFLLLSDYCTFKPNGHLHWNTSQEIYIDCQDPLNNVDTFLQQITIIPSIKHLDHLEISGNLHINSPIQLSGTIKLHVPQNKQFQPTEPTLHNIELSENLTYNPIP